MLPPFHLSAQLPATTHSPLLPFMIRLVLADGAVVHHTKLLNLSLAAHSVSVSDVGTFFGGGHPNID